MIAGLGRAWIIDTILHCEVELGLILDRALEITAEIKVQ